MSEQLFEPVDPNNTKNRPIYVLENFSGRTWVAPLSHPLKYQQTNLTVDMFKFHMLLRALWNLYIVF